MNWKLDYIENINIDKKKFSYGSNIFAYKREKKYGEIIFTIPNEFGNGFSKPEINDSLKIKKNELEKELSKKFAKSNNKIVFMHLLNSQWGGEKLFTISDSNSPINLILGSPKSNKEHSKYEKKITNLAYRCNKWNMYIQKNNIDTNLNKIAVQTSTWVPNKFNYNKKAYKHLILKIRLIKINKNGSIKPQMKIYMNGIGLKNGIIQMIKIIQIRCQKKIQKKNYLI